MWRGEPAVIWASVEQDYVPPVMTAFMVDGTLLHILSTYRAREARSELRYFRHPKALTPQRYIELEGAYEIRDIGGYSTQDGRRTRWRTLLRSANLDKLTPESQQALIDYGVRTVIDLRIPDELERRPDVFARSMTVTYHHHDLVGEEFMRIVSAQTSTVLGPYIGRWTLEKIQHILDHRRAHICGTLATLAEPGRLPAIIHCSAGKGRTGLIVALMMGLAGVPPEIIAEDYALTAAVRWSRRSENVPSPGADSPYMSWEEYLQACCPTSAMHQTLELLNHEYGGIKAYVRDGGLTDEQVHRIRSGLVE